MRMSVLVTKIKVKILSPVSLWVPSRGSSLEGKSDSKMSPSKVGIIYVKLVKSLAPFLSREQKTKKGDISEVRNFTEYREVFALL